MLIWQHSTSAHSYQFSNEYGSDSNSSSDSVEWHQPEPVRICTADCDGDSDSNSNSAAPHALQDPTLSCSRQARFAADLRRTFNLLFVNRQMCLEASNLYNRAEYRFLGVPCFRRFSELMGPTRCRHVRRVRVVAKSRKAWAFTAVEMADWLRERKVDVQGIGRRWYGRCAWRDTTRYYNDH